MTTLSQFSASPSVAAIFNADSSGSPAGIVLSGVNSRFLTFQSGALTSGILARPTGFSAISGAGAVNGLILYTNDATARTIRLQLKIDGVTVFDSTSASISASNTGLVAIGFTVGAGTTFALEKKIFNASMDIQVASSLSETNKIAIGIIYETY